MELVPPELLVPPDAHARGFCRHDAALVLDGYLRRLSAQDARCRRILGRLAHVFLRQHGHHTLGFARLGDYVRERLGLSAREIQSLASVSTHLDRLPLIRGAFDRGELSWAKVRLLSVVAAPESETGWMELARPRTVRALEALIRQAQPGAHDDDGTEPQLRFRFRCPRRLVQLWRDVVELARRVAGADLAPAQATEAIAAEGLSARPPIAEACALGTRTAGADGPGDPSEACATVAELDWTAVAEAIPPDVEALGDQADDLDPFALDARLRAVVQARQRIDWQTGRLLRVFLDRRLDRLMGFSSAARYLGERLGLSERRARALVALERKTWQAPGLGDAYRRGELSWVRALTVVPVITEETAPAWLARAREVTVRRLVDEVEWALAAGEPFSPLPPPPPGATLEKADRQTCAPGEPEWPDAEIVFSAPATVIALFRSAVFAFTAPADAPWKGLEQLLLHVKAEWESQPRHRDPVFARDGWRCAVPVCTSRRHLHDHHVVYRSHGGDNAPDNRIAICAWHHLRGIHAGRVRALGRAPDTIIWELGVRRSSEPLMRLQGDRYTVA